MRPSVRAPKKPTLGRPLGKFTQHRRLDRLRDLLEREPQGLTIQELALALRITERSIRRYLHEVADTLNLEPVRVTPGGAQRWRIRATERVRAVPLRRSQAFALLAGARVFEPLRGSALFDEVQVAMQRLRELAERPVRGPARGELPPDTGLRERFFVFAPPARSYAQRGEDLDALLLATAELRPVKVLLARATVKITLHPYAFVVSEGDVYVIAKHVEQGEVLPFRLSELDKVEPNEKLRFRLPDNLDVEAFLHGTQGLAPPTKGRAVLEFDARVADEVRARRFHPQQKLATAPDGRTRLSVPLADRRAVLAFVFSFGDAAQIVEPIDLAEEARAVLGRAAARYRP